MRFRIAGLLIASPLVLAAGCPTVTGSGSVAKPSALDELSGMASGIRNPTVVYGHNDSGDTARFLAFVPGGAVRATFALSGVTAVDWEDIDVAEVAGQSWVYLSDTGNNDLDRGEVAVYRIAEPSLPASNQTVTLTGAEKLRIAYPSGDEDAEALAVEPGTGALILATRDRDDTGETRIYRAVPKTDGTAATAVLVRSLADPDGGFRTKGADWFPGKRLVLLRHSSDSEATVLVGWDAPVGASLATIVTPSPCLATLDDFEQAEALCFLPGGSEIIVGGEGGSDPLRKYRVTDLGSQGWRVK